MATASWQPGGRANAFAWAAGSSRRARRPPAAKRAISHTPPKTGSRDQYPGLRAPKAPRMVGREAVAMPRGPGTVQGRRAATTGAATIGDACAPWIIFLCYAPEKSIFCAGEDTDPKIGDEGRIPPGDPHATLVAIFGDSKRARRHYCPGGGRMGVRGALWRRFGGC